MKKLEDSYPGCFAAWRKRGMPNHVLPFFECPSIMSAYRLDSWNVRAWHNNEFLGDPRGSNKPWVLYANQFFEHGLLVINQKDPCSGMDSASMFKMDFRYVQGTQTVEAKAKLAVRASLDRDARSGAG